MTEPHDDHDDWERDVPEITCKGMVQEPLPPDEDDQEDEEL